MCSILPTNARNSIFAWRITCTFDARERTRERIRRLNHNVHSRIHCMCNVLWMRRGHKDLHSHCLQRVDKKKKREKKESSEIPHHHFIYFSFHWLGKMHFHSTEQFLENELKNRSLLFKRPRRCFAFQNHCRPQFAKKRNVSSQITHQPKQLNDKINMYLVVYAAHRQMAADAAAARSRRRSTFIRINSFEQFFCISSHFIESIPISHSMK